MEQFDSYLNSIQNWIWGIPLLLLLMGTGIYLTFILKGVQFRYLSYAFKQISKKQQTHSSGDISHFEALMTSLAGAIGTGSIVGVATALSIGGMGSIFWMWVTAIFSMATKYAESLLAVKFREKDTRGEMIGGPMQYIEKGLGWKRLAMIFAALGAVAAFGIGNLVQINSIAEAATDVWSVNPWVTGIILSIITGAVLIGGVKSIGHVAGVLVPVMALFYLAGGILILILYIDKVPSALLLMVTSAFQGQAAAGGFLGATVMMAIQAGVTRSVFSNEAGLGVSSIAAAAAKTDTPGRQAMINMAGALLSTIVICTITALVIAVTGVFNQSCPSGEAIRGACMAIEAFRSSLPGGQYIISIGLILFAYSTVIAWAYYGEKCFEYLLGDRSVLFYRLIFTLAVIPAGTIKLETVWHLANIANGLMAIPNLIALIALSGVIVAETKVFLDIVGRETKTTVTLLRSA